MQHAENESDDDDAEWESFNEPEVAPTVDLFSDRVFESAAAALAHAKAAHGLDLASIAFGLKLDIYGRVRLVNYVRSRAAAADESAAIVKSVKEGASSSNGATWPWAGGGATRADVGAKRAPREHGTKLPPTRARTHGA